MIMVFAVCYVLQIDHGNGHIAVTAQQPRFHWFAKRFVHSVKPQCLISYTYAFILWHYPGLSKVDVQSSSELFRHLMS